MVQLYLIGVSAGAAAALLFASVASGSPLSLLLFYLSPLPILIAALGWSHWAALIAAVVASAGLAAIFGGFFFVAFLVVVGLPAWALGYLALLARPATTPGGLEWYPVGHLVFAAALIGALIVALGVLYTGPDEERFHAAVRKGLERMFQVGDRAPEGTSPARPDFSSLIELLVLALPPAAAVLASLTSVINLWLAEQVVKVSGRLRRPPPDLSAMRLPRFAAAATALALGLSFVPGMPGLLSGVFGASLLMAYAILGFAVLHAVTRGMSSRPFALGGIYVAVVAFGWPVLVMTALGLADNVFDLRGRAAHRRPPPLPGA